MAGKRLVDGDVVGVAVDHLPLALLAAVDVGDAQGVRLDRLAARATIKPLSMIDEFESGRNQLHGDKGYNYPRCRKTLRARGITPRIARRGIESSQKLGQHRYVVERSLAWLVGHRRLQVRNERRADILLGFLHLASALICLRSLVQPTG